MACAARCGSRASRPSPRTSPRYGPLEDESGERRFALRLIGSAKGVLIAAISGIEDRDRAEALRGLRLYLPRSALPPPEEDEYYHADLIGLEAVLADGTPVGTGCARCMISAPATRSKSSAPKGRR